MFQAFAIVIAVTILWAPTAVGFTRSSASPSPFGTKSFLSIHDDNGSRRRDIAPTNCHKNREKSTMKSSRTPISWGSSPYLAILTEPDACTSVERVEETIHAIEQATMDGGVNLVIVRVADGPGNESALHKWALLKNLAEMKQRRRFLLVVNDDVEIVLKALSQNITVDGVHVKEYKAHLIPSIRSKLEHAVTCSFNNNNSSSYRDVIIGTSCHSLESATKSYQLSPRGPDYLFVGTCYLTQSHPEKQSLDQLEGPTLPGRVREELYQIYNDKDGTSIDAETIISRPTSTLSPPPIIFAIGGIDEQNCHEPVVRFGADGVATISAVMQSSDPREVVRRMKSIMQNQKDNVDEK